MSWTELSSTGAANSTSWTATATDATATTSEKGLRLVPVPLAPIGDSAAAIQLFALETIQAVIMDRETPLLL